MSAALVSRALAVHGLAALTVDATRRIARASRWSFNSKISDGREVVGVEAGRPWADLEAITLS